MVDTERPILTLAELEAVDPHAPASGRERRFVCPLLACADKPKNAAHRSLSLNVERGSWTCYRCGGGGQLREQWQPRGKGDAARRAFGLPVASVRRGSNPKTRAREGAPEVAPSDWRDQLCDLRPVGDDPQALAYLSRRGISRALAAAADVEYAPGFYGRPAVIFPVVDHKRATVAVQGRYIDGRENPKARTAGELKQGLFKTPEALDLDRLVVCEAPLDALSLHLAGVPAVALCGTNAPAWLPTAAAFKTVALAFDADDAGDQAVAKLEPVLRSFGAEVERWRPVEAKDWNQLLTERGLQALRAALPRL